MSILGLVPTISVRVVGSRTYKDHREVVDGGFEFEGSPLCSSSTRLDSTRYNNDPTYTTRWRFDLVKLISKYLRRLLENNRLRVTNKETRVRGTESFRRLIQKVSESSRHLSTRWTPRTSRNPQVSHPSHPLAEL